MEHVVEIIDSTDRNRMTYPLSSVEGLAITVLGAARSGLAVAHLLASKGASVFVSDAGSAKSLAAAAAELGKNGIELETGRHSERVFACDLIVLSPGVPSDAPVVVAAIQRGIDVVSELECASWFCKGPIVAVTGSNGKTTTTSLIGRMLGDARIRHGMAGNIGIAFSAVVRELSPDDVSVLEVSSFQLDHIRSFRPAVSVLLNITPDHMDRYGNSMERYAASKARIAMNQGQHDLLVYNADDRYATDIAARAQCTTLPFSIQQTLTEGAWIERGEIIFKASGMASPVISVSDISLKGMHNAANAMAAMLASQRYGVSAASIRATLKNFKGVEHRLEFVRDVRGIQYVNDSKATNIDSVMVALRAFDEPLVLILGGRDKGNDYRMLYELVRDRVRAIVAIGESAEVVRSAFAGVVRVEKADSMEAAVTSATACASAGDVVLLSPACSSFDWFDNYEHRGRVFKDIVKAL